MRESWGNLGERKPRDMMQNEMRTQDFIFGYSPPSLDWTKGVRFLLRDS